MLTRVDVIIDKPDDFDGFYRYYAFDKQRKLHCVAKSNVATTIDFFLARAEVNMQRYEREQAEK